MNLDDRPYANPDHPGNKIRPRVKCWGCGTRGCTTAWGDWCFECNVKRLTRLDAQFAALEASLDDGSPSPVDSKATGA